VAAEAAKAAKALEQKDAAKAEKTTAVEHATKQLHDALKADNPTAVEHATKQLHDALKATVKAIVQAEAPNDHGTCSTAMSSKMPGTSVPPAKRPYTPAELDAEDALPKGTKTEATKAAAKAKRTIESEAAAKTRRLNDLNLQLTSAQIKQATRLRELQDAEQAKKHAEEQVEKHVGDWAKQCTKKAMITKYQKAQDRHKTWIDAEERIEKEIARLTTEAAVH
jgi:hypothetical protein